MEVIKLILRENREHKQTELSELFSRFQFLTVQNNHKSNARVKIH